MTLRILQVLPNLVPYGLENMVAGLARSLDRRRFEPAVVSLFGEAGNGLEPSLRASGVRLFHLDKRPGLDVRMYPRLWHVLREFRPHVLHTHNYVLRYAWPAAVAARVPAVVHTVHNVADREVDRAGRWLQSIAFRRGVAAVAIAGEVSASFRRVYGFAEAALIPNGIPVERYRTSAVSREVWRADNGIDAGEFVYLSVARFDTQKNHATLIEAFHRGPARLPGTRLLLVGGGELRGQIEARVERLGLAGKVTFLGQRSDIPEALAAADVFVLASLWEGNPLSVMEAMAAGLPVVATSVGAVPELVRNGVDGLLVPPADTSALANAMALVGERRDSGPGMGSRGAMRARERFDQETMVRSYAELYERVLGGAGDSLARGGSPSRACPTRRPA